MTFRQSQAETSKEIDVYNTENNSEAAAVLVYALNVKKSTKPFLVDFIEVSQMFVNAPPPNSDSACAYLFSNCYVVEPFDTTPVLLY